MAGVGMMLMISLVIFGLGLFLFLTFSRRQRLGMCGKETPLDGSPQSIVMAGAGSGTFTFSMGFASLSAAMADVCGRGRGSRFIGAQFTPGLVRRIGLTAAGGNVDETGLGR